MTEEVTGPLIEAEHKLIDCPVCGKEISATAPTCPHCGEVFEKAPKVRLKERSAAVLLAAFGGGFGIHRFYLGQWWGLAYVLLYWTYIPLLIGLGEAVYFASRDQEEWDKKYNDGVSTAPPKGEPWQWGTAAVVVALLAGSASVYIISWSIRNNAAQVEMMSFYQSSANCSQVEVRLREIMMRNEQRMMEYGQSGGGPLFVASQGEGGVELRVERSDHRLIVSGRHEDCVDEDGDQVVVVYDSEAGTWRGDEQSLQDHLKEIKLTEEEKARAEKEAAIAARTVPLAPGDEYVDRKEKTDAELLDHALQIMKEK